VRIDEGWRPSRHSMFFWGKCDVSLLEPREVVAYSRNSETGGGDYAHQANPERSIRRAGCRPYHGVRDSDQRDLRAYGDN
jgi:hypothetical protein